MANKNTKGSTLKRIILVFILVLIIMAIGVGCGFLTATMNTRPNFAEDITPSASSHIYDVHGNEIANIHATENRVPVKLESIPKNLQNAFIAVEDARFYEHAGVDPRGILRALWTNIMDRDVAEGGSTITQQLAKNAYLTQERTLKRKIQEAFLALQIERQFTKKEILELYLNQIYFGQGAYGVEAAAQTYFGKDVKDLDLNEAALIAGIPKSPNYYSPFNNLEAAQARKATVLSQMEKYNYIDHKTAEKTKKEKIRLINPKESAQTHEASYFIEYITQMMIDRYGADAVYKDGLKIYTTIDMDMQRAAENAMSLLPTFETDNNGLEQPQGALVAIEPATGEIRAMVGGRGTDHFNRATMAERQPGSAFKPFVFIAALESNYSPSTVIEDSPITIGDWSPENYNRNFNGKVSLRTVAEYSLNVPTVKIAQKVGMDKIIFYAQEMGITTFVLEGAKNDRNLASALGGLTRGVTPLELTSAFSTFPNGGIHVEATAILKVLDRRGKILEEASPKTRRVVEERNANQLNDILQGVVAHGTGTGANIGRPVAGKTGTTSDYLDAWFVGYTPNLVASVWIGCDDNSDLGGMTGGTLPATIWQNFMLKATENLPAEAFPTVNYQGDTVTAILDDKKNKKDIKDKKNTKNISDKEEMKDKNTTKKYPLPARFDDKKQEEAYDDATDNEEENAREERQNPPLIRKKAGDDIENPVVSPAVPPTPGAGSKSRN